VTVSVLQPSWLNIFDDYHLSRITSSSISGSQVDEIRDEQRTP